MSFISVILVAGGLGTRMKTSVPKQFLLLNEKPVARYSFDLFSSLEEVKEIVVVCEPTYRSLFPTASAFAFPGARRQDSVFNGLQCVSEKADFVCIHDSARPFVALEELQILFKEAKTHKAATLAAPMKCTIKEATADGFVARTLDRSLLWEIQTPQIMSPDLLRQGFAIAKEQNLTMTDDASLVELTGHPVKLVCGSSRNLKLTTPDDWAVANAALLPSLCPSTS